MTEPFGRLRRFLRELKRRNVYKVAVTYAAVVFVGLQAVRLLVPATTLPGWADELLIAFAVLGFPIAIVLAWAFEMTAEGVRRTPEANGEAPGSSAYQWVGLILVVALAGGVWYATAGDGARSSAETAPAADSATDEQPTAPRLGTRSIAVLPFDNLSGSADAQPFVNGIHDDLLTRLSNVSELKVISRTSVMPYRETGLSVRAIADSLGVRWVVEGGVQQAADRVQVNAQLIDAQADVHRWAESYQRKLTTENLFAIQSELTKKIARSLEAQLTTGETERVERRPTGDLDAYRLYVEGRTRLNRRTEEGMRRAIELFRLALARDSGYALAWSGLADAQNLLAFYGHVPRDSVRSQALHAARRAVGLDPDLAEAHASLGLSQEQLHRDGPAAIREYRRAVELKRSYHEARHWFGWLLLVLGRPDPGIGHLEAAVELDPHSPAIRTSLAQGLWLARGPNDRALKHLRRATELERRYTLAHAAEGLLLLDSGRIGKARVVLGRALEQATTGSFVWGLCVGGLGTAHARRGDTTRTRALLKRLDEGRRAPLATAMLQVALGEETDALDNLADLDLRGMNVAYLRYLPMLDPLRDDPRYDKLIREANRAWGLDPDGRLAEGVDVSLDAQADE